MIPNPGYPSQEQASRAMSQADEFVRRTRQQAQQQMAQQHQTYTGGAQPGVMSYVGAGAGMAARGGGMVAAGGATALGMGAAMAQPISSQIMQAGAGARAGAMPQGFFGLLTTAYAPQGMLPHAATAFHMERGVRREFAQEELGRRWDMFGRRAVSTAGDLFTLGISSHIMRRTGVEARLFTEMSTERMLQKRLGSLRGQGQHMGPTGFGVRRSFLTEGAGAGAMDELMRGSQDLQSEYGYNREQLDMMTQGALGAIDVSRIQRAGSRPGGMRDLGREAKGMREQLARAAREMQIMDTEFPQFMEQLKGSMKVTADSIKTFVDETRATGRAGPFSQRQAGQMGMQYMQFGRGQYFNPTRFRGEAFTRAIEVAQLRERGVIGAETQLREGGSLDQEGMQRMLMQRMQIQSQAVQGGQFNQELILAGGNRGAYNEMMGGGGYFQTQGAVAGTLMRDPFALLRARLNPEARERVTQDAKILAFRKTQQMMRMLPGGRDQAISMFGKRFGMTPEQAQPWYEEEELQTGSARSLVQEFGLAEGDEDSNRVADFLRGFSRRTGLGMRDLGVAARTLGKGNLGSTPASMERNILGAMNRMKATRHQNAIKNVLGPLSKVQGDINVVAGMGTSNAWNQATTLGQLHSDRSDPATRAIRNILGVATEKNLNAMMGRASDALGPGATQEDLERAVLGSSSGWELTEQNKLGGGDSFGDYWARTWRSGLGGALTGVTGLRTALAERSRLSVQGGKVVAQYQQWEPTKDQWDRIQNEGLTTLPQKWIEGAAGWGATKTVTASSEAGRFYIAQRLGTATGRFSADMRGRVGYETMLRTAGGTMGALRGILGKNEQGQEILPEKLSRDKFNELLDTDKNEKIFSRIEGRNQLRPLASVIQAFTAGGQLEEGAHSLITGALPRRELNKIIGRFRPEAEIKTVMASAESFKEFMGSLGGERKEFATQMLQSAMERSDRLAKASPLGSMANQMWVQWEGQTRPGTE